jgi:hypothetical protein
MGEQVYSNQYAEAPTSSTMDTLKPVGCSELLEVVSTGCVQNPYVRNQGS